MPDLVFYPYLLLASNLKLKPLFGPYSVMVDIEDECDLHCRMCYFHSPFIEEKFKASFTRMEFSVFKNLIAEFNYLRVKKLILCGKGEPFLHPEIMRMIKLVKENNFILHIFTNGIHITKDVLEELLSLKVERLIFSLHAGDYETYKNVHPEYPEKFEHIEKILFEIKEYKRKYRSKKPYIKIVNVIYKDNFQKISEMIKFARRYCVDEIMFKPLQVYPQQREMELQPQDIKYVIDNLSACRWKFKNNIKKYLGYISSQLKGDSPVNLRGTIPEKRKCFLPWYQAVIMTSGDIVFCTYNQIRIGNIYDNNFSRVWFSDKYQDMRKNLPCGKCPGSVVYPFLNVFSRI